MNERGVEKYGLENFFFEHLANRHVDVELKERERETNRERDCKSLYKMIILAAKLVGNYLCALISFICI